MPNNQIHPTAVVSPSAVLGEDIHIGAYAVIEDNTVLGDGCRIGHRVVIKNGVVLGKDNELHDGAIVGGRPQHLRADEQIGAVRIGDENMIRENVTIHCALKPGEETIVGDGNMLMINTHIAHDCRIGNHTIIANNTLLAGHITIEDRAYLSGMVGAHQFVRIGCYAMVGGMGHVKADVPPYVLIDGDTNKVVGLNLIGLRRGGFSTTDIKEMKAAYRVIYRSGLRWQEVLERLQAEFPTGPAAHFHRFLSTCKRGCVQERRVPKTATIPMPTADDHAELRIRKAA